LKKRFPPPILVKMNKLTKNQILIFSNPTFPNKRLKKNRVEDEKLGLFETLLRSPKK
jgi:hypothetical protein